MESRIYNALTQASNKSLADGQRLNTAQIVEIMREHGLLDSQQGGLI